MAEQPKPATPPPPPSVAAGGGGSSGPKVDAFDRWLRGALRQPFGAAADESAPEALRRLAAEIRPAAEAGAMAAEPPSRAGDVRRRTRERAARRRTA